MQQFDCPFGNLGSDGVRRGIDAAYGAGLDQPRRETDDRDTVAVAGQKDGRQGFAIVDRTVGKGEQDIDAVSPKQ